MISRDVSGFEIQNTEVPLITDGEIIALNPNLN